MATRQRWRSFVKKKNLLQPKIHKEYEQAENLRDITLEVTG